MADVAAALRSWSSTPSSNSPTSATTIGSGLAGNLQQIQATIRQYLASQATDMASATTVDLSTANGYYVNITGTTTIASFGTESAGISYLLKFASTPQITYNATSMILPGAANITAAAGDLMLVISEGGGNWRCVHYLAAGSGPTGKLVTAKGDILAATASNALSRVAVGADGQVLTANASATPGVKWAYPITIQTEQASTSGTSIDFTGIPSTARRVTIMFVGVSTNGSSNVIIRVGSGSIDSTGYLGSQYLWGGSATNFTTEFLVRAVAAASTIHGSLVLNLENSSTNTWVATGAFGFSDTNAGATIAGSKSLSGALDRVRITTANGTDTFDAGAINVSYE